MARGNQTFKKRQRENKLREKAQLKRERRQERRSEKKKGLDGGMDDFAGDMTSAQSVEAMAAEEDAVTDGEFVAEREA
jgi:hypothetical protein